MSDVQTVFLSEDIIPLDIKIDASTTIPQFISRIPGEASHVFKKILIQNATKTRNEYLTKLFSGTLKSTEAQKRFFIEELEIVDDQKNRELFKNMLITFLKNKLSLSELGDQNPHSKYLHNYVSRKPQWSRQPTQVLEKSIARTEPNELGSKLEQLKDKLEALKKKLKQLAQTLKSLKIKLKT